MLETCTATPLLGTRRTTRGVYMWHMPFPAVGAFPPKSASSATSVLVVPWGKSRASSHSRCRLGTTPTSSALKETLSRYLLRDRLFS